MRYNFTSLGFILLIISNFLLLTEIISAENGFTPDQHINYGLEFLYRGNYDFCIKECEKALQIEPGNARALNTIAITYARQNQWEKSILFSEQALKTKPDYPEAYDNLCQAYLGNQQWEEAMTASKEAMHRYPESDIPINYFNNAETGFLTESYSQLLIPVFVFLIVFFFFFLTRKSKTAKVQPVLFSELSMLEIFLTSASVSFIFYFLFFLAAPFIRSLNTIISFTEVTPVIRGSVHERDGIETYVLYGITLTGIGLAFALVSFIKQIKTATAYYALVFLFSLLTFGYLASIGFYPPWSHSSPTVKNFAVVMLLVSAVIFVLYLASKYNYSISIIVASVILFPACFVNTQPIVIWDYGFVLTPSLKLMQGFSIRDIYFQYDLLLSFIGWVWLKLKMDIYLFQIVGQFSLYFFMLAILFLSRKLFINKHLSILLFVFLIIVRSYAKLDDHATTFQTTSLRLDLWLILLFAVYWKGAHHWLTGLLVALLVLLHKTFGIIYFAAYLQLLFILFLTEALTTREAGASLLNHGWKIFRKHVLLSWVNLALIACGIIVSMILLGGFTPESVRLYGNLGIGMIPISKTSFFWHFPVVLSMLVIFLFKYRTALTSPYFVTGVFLVLLTAGNCIYFFGRSHEHNLINISGVLSFSLFLLFDILLFHSSGSDNGLKIKAGIPAFLNWLKKGMSNRHGLKYLLVFLLPLVSLVIVSFYYGNRISRKVKVQYINIAKGEIILPSFEGILSPPSPENFEAIKKLTGSSPKVHFLNWTSDFLHYKYGGYNAEGYFNPCAAWVTKKDWAVFLQKLLDEHYYLVTNTAKLNYSMEMLPMLSFNHIAAKDGYTAVSLNETEPVLNREKKYVLQLTVNDTLGAVGFMKEPVELSPQFTIQCLLKPSAEQNPDATVFSNVREITGARGMMLRQAGSETNNYFFAYGDSRQWITSDTFKLPANEYSFVVIAVDSACMKVFVNGSTVSSVLANSIIENSGLPFMLGCRDTFNVKLGLDANEPPLSYDRPYRGFLHELKISNNCLDEQAIKDEWDFINNKNRKKELKK